MISMDKQYRTRSKIPVRVLCTDRNDERPVIALFPSGYIFAYYADGKNSLGKKTLDDLIHMFKTFGHLED